MRYILTILTIFTYSIVLPAQDKQSENDVFVPIAKYLENGNATNLSAWFADNVELVIFGSRNNCSRNQAKQIMRNFFINYTPNNFDVVHKSGNYPMKYAIGVLEGGGNEFKVTIFVKTTERGNHIQQLSIEKE